MREEPTTVGAQRLPESRARKSRGRPAPLPWASAAVCGLSEVWLESQAGGGRLVPQRCGTAWCIDCQRRRLGAALDAVQVAAGAVPADATWYFLRISPKPGESYAPEGRVDGPDGASEFGKRLAAFSRSLVRVDVASGMRAYGGATVLEAVPKPGESSNVGCPLCAFRRWGPPSEGLRGRGGLWTPGTVVRADLAWRRMEEERIAHGLGACILCGGHGFLCGAHVHAHVIMAGPRMWFGRDTIPDYLKAKRAELARACTLEEVARLSRSIGAAERAEREGWATLPDGRGLAALLDRYGLGHSHSEVIEKGVGGACAYLGKVCSYGSKVAGEEAEGVHRVVLGMHHGARFQGVRTVRTWGVVAGHRARVTRAGNVGMRMSKPAGAEPDRSGIMVGPVRVVTVGALERRVRYVPRRCTWRAWRRAALRLVARRKRKVRGNVRPMPCVERTVTAREVRFADGVYPAGTPVGRVRADPADPKGYRRHRDRTGLGRYLLGGAERYEEHGDLVRTLVPLLARDRATLRKLGKPLGFPGGWKSSVCRGERAGLARRTDASRKRAERARASVGRSVDRLRALERIERDYRAGRRQARGASPGTVPAWVRDARQACASTVRKRGSGYRQAAAVFMVRTRALERAKSYQRGVWLALTGAAWSVGIGEAVAGYVNGPEDARLVLPRLRDMVRRVAACLPRGALRGLVHVYRAIARVASCGSLAPLLEVADVGGVERVST